MKKRTFKRLAAALLTGAMMVGMMGATVCAEGTGNASNATTSFAKTLNSIHGTDEDDYSAVVSEPDIEFSYTIDAGSAVAANATNKTPEILAGVDASKVDIENAVFTSDTSDWEDQVTVDFSNVSFTEPGIYRYVLTETASGKDYIDDDSTATRYLDVFVEYEDTTASSGKTYKVVDYVLSKTAYAYDTDVTTGKDEGYTNTYKTYDLTLTKEVAGNMGDTTEPFEFTITFTTTEEAHKNVSFKVDNQTVSLVDGEYTTTVNLAHGESFVVNGIPSTVSYVITETDYSAEGYATKYSLNNGVDVEELSVSSTTGLEDDTIDFTNTKAVDTPTGVITTFAPYILMVAFAAVVAFFFLRRRREF